MQRAVTSQPVALPEPASINPVHGCPSRVVSIDLPEDQDCGHPGRCGYCFCAVRTGGDVLEGHIAYQLNSPGDITIDVCFEGFSRTWIPDDAYNGQTVNETCFLQQVDTIKIRAFLEDGPVPCTSEIRTTPFKIKIAERLPVASDATESDPRFQQLCPSMTSGSTHKNCLTGAVYMQPLIFYRLSTSVRTKARELQSPRIGIVRELAIMPKITAQPPTYTGHFTEEYKMEHQVKVRRHFYGHARGSLELSAEEPRPINVLEPSARPSTTVFLKASFQPHPKISVRTIEPYNWAFRIRTRLRRRIFYATRHFDKEPTVLDARQKPYVDQSTQVIQSEEREYTKLSWRIDHISPHGTIVPADSNAAPWIVTIPVMFTADKSLTPSFLSATVALRYSILVDMKILGQLTSHAVLKIPLQVIRDPRFPTRDSYPWMYRQLTEPADCIEDDMDEECSDAEPGTRPPRYRRWAY